MKSSEEMGYSVRALTQGEALTLRKLKEPGVEVQEGVWESYMTEALAAKRNFFPGKGQFQGGGGRGGRGGRGSSWR